MNKRIGNIEIEHEYPLRANSQITITKHHNDLVRQSITIKGIEDLNDLGYAIKGLKAMLIINGVNENIFTF